MSASNKKADLFGLEERAAVEQALRQMESDSAFSTDASYSANGVLYPDNLISFVDKHMNYLKQHQNVNPYHYLANLRLMTKLKTK